MPPPMMGRAMTMTASLGEKPMTQPTSIAKSAANSTEHSSGSAKRAPTLTSTRESMPRMLPVISAAM